MTSDIFLTRLPKYLALLSLQQGEDIKAKVTQSEQFSGI
jgi:hypothetical protein